MESGEKKTTCEKSFYTWKNNRRQNFAMAESMEKNSVEKTNIEQIRCKNCGGKSHPVELCPHKEQGTRCFRCNDFGHIGKFCSNKVDDAQIDEAKTAQIIDTGIHISSWRVQMLHGKTRVNAVVCMGFAKTFIRKSCISKFDCLPEKSQAPISVQFYNRIIETMGSYELHMTIGHEGFYIQCHVVEDEFLMEELQLGMNFVQDVEIVVKKGSIKIRRATVESDDEDDNNSNDWAKEVERINI